MRPQASLVTCIAGGFLAALALTAVAAPSLLRLDPLAVTGQPLAPPSGDQWMGTDELGRSVWIQVIYGAQTSLTVGLAAALSATLLGAVVGAVAAFGGTRIDTAVMRLTEFFQVMPSFILAAVIVALWGPGISRVVLVISILSWPQVARLMRAEVLRLKTLGFVDAARCLGLSERSILWREIVPNAAVPVITVAALIVGQAILLEAGLSYFGLTSPDQASWGKMLNSGQRFVYQAWWLSVFPGALIFMTVLAFNLLGEELAEVFSPRGRRG